MWSRATGEQLKGYAFISPWLIGFMVFTLGPMVVSLVASFSTWTMLSPPTWVGLENYKRIVGDDAFFVVSLVNTGVYVLLSVPAATVLALSLALLLHQRLPGMNYFRAIFFLPSITNLVAISIVWIWVFNPEFGLLNTALRVIGVAGPLWLQSETWAKPALVIMSLWSVGGSMVIFLAALQGVPPELYEAAALDGAGKMRQFVSITIPMISPALFFSLVIGLIGGFQVFTQAFVMTGTAQPGTEGGPNNATLFVVLYLYKKAFQEFKIGYASALAWILFALILLFTLVQRRLAQKWVYYEAGEQ
jgi:multiple sugar transport system permease protein